MGPVLVVVAPVDGELGLSVGEVMEYLNVQTVPPESGIEALDIGVLPWGARLYEVAAGPTRSKEHSKAPGDELRTVIRPEEYRCSALGEKGCQDLLHPQGLEARVGFKGKAFPGGLVHDRQNFETRAV